ncbi:MAG: hypothetical protein GY785_10930 [Gammaproteobacteria bacterium]|nr:hypothetical protein [Gammaproteobacteria bacterium]MCP4978998.1 hypothetical protein [Gammaproteobacteria bacterium]
MATKFTQKGITLLEVLVGFVIFTASLVAILDYVGSQIFHVHRSAEYLQRMQRVYQTSGYADPQAVTRTAATGHEGRFDWDINVSEMGSIEKRDTTLFLKRYDYSLTEAGNTLTWSVIRLE